MNSTDDQAQQQSKSASKKRREIDLGLDWDDIAEAYVGTLAALLTVSVFVMLAGARHRRRRWPR